jgi:phosphomannomutase
MKKTKFIFDVDGTLTPSRGKIDPEFKNWFLGFCQDNDVYLVSGSDYQKTVEQLGEYLCRWPVFIYSCSGNEVWGKHQQIKSKHWDAPTELYDLLNSWLAASKFPVRTGNHIEERSGCINFSVVGRNATLGGRNLYKEWDEENRERESIAFQINSTFNDITATIGGETGIDIHPTGWDKSQILKDFDTKNDRIFFFGDKTQPGGNDYPLAKQLKNVYQVNSWRQTWETLQFLKEAKIAF